MTRSRLGPLPPEAFDKDLPMVDPAEIDSHYSADYLAQRQLLGQRIARVTGAGKAPVKPAAAAPSRFVETGEGLIIEPPAKPAVKRYRLKDDD